MYIPCFANELASLSLNFSTSKDVRTGKEYVRYNVSFGARLIFIHGKRIFKKVIQHQPNN